MKKPIFQFSLIDDENLETCLIEAIAELGGEIEESPYYCASATHLIVDRLQSTEKCLCFIASGKWILTDKYIKKSLSAGRFLSEDEFHVLNAFPSSTLALSSNKWKKVIDESKTNAPFINWKVACFISDETKARAIIRLIKAGGGEAVQIKKIQSSIRFTLVIHDDESKSVGEKFATERDIPHYPHLLIADHLLYSVPSKMPVLPIKYYDSLSSDARSKATSDQFQTKRKSEICMETEEKLLDKAKPFQFLAKVVEYFLQPLKFYIKNDFYAIKLLEWTAESRFSNLWRNRAYSQALFYLKNCDDREIVSQKSFILLLEFLLADKSKIVEEMQFGNKLNRNETNKIYNDIYINVMGYVTNKLRKFAPCGENIAYYSEVFHVLSMDSRLEKMAKNARNIKQFVDVLYLMCIHDYILAMDNIRKTRFIQNGALIVDKMYSEKKLCELVEIMVKQKEEVSETTCEKMIQIIAFCHKQYENSRLCERMAELYYSEEPLNPKAPVTLQSIFLKALNSL